MTSRNQYHPETVTHPKDILQEALDERQIGPKEFAVRTGKPEKTISAVLRGNSTITSDMAILFEKVLKIPAHFWIELQRNYDVYVSQLDYQKTIQEGVEWAKGFPYSKMANFGWVEKTRKPKAKVIALYDYFGIANVKAYDDYYHNQKLLVNFRISLKNNENSKAIAAWLRRGEILASENAVKGFNINLLKSILPKIKKVMANQPSDFFIQLKSLCATVGIKLVYTPNLPKAPIHGSTRWIGDTPLIQLSCRYKRNDIFWFTFFHEIGHILLHGKKYISIENIEYDGENNKFEEEADEFAIKWTLSKNEEKEILDNIPLDDDNIVRFAKKFGTHPALIIGRLQHLDLISFGMGNHHFQAINFIE